MSTTPSISNELSKLVEELKQNESECIGAKEHLANIKGKFAAAQALIAEAQAEVGTTTKNLADANGRKTTLLKQIADLVKIEDAPSPETLPTTVDAVTAHAILSKSVDGVNLTVRCINALKSQNIHCIGDLIQFTEVDLLQTGKIGRKSLGDIKEVLASFRFSLKV